MKPFFALLIGAALSVSLSLTPVLSKGKDILELQWEKLIPEHLLTLEDKEEPWQLDHDPNAPASEFIPSDEDKTPAPLVTKFNGKRVRIGGYVVPLDLEAKKVKEFLLVPYIGACIHVPPPPANQIIYVKIDKPVEVTGLFDPVIVTGTLNTGAMSTQLASEVGYRMEAEKVAPYDEVQ